MHSGHYISGAGHLGLIGWLLFGNIFTSEPDPVEMTEVSVISAAEYDALVAGPQAPDSTIEVAQPAPPEVPEEAPDVTAEPDTAIEQPEPVQTETPPEDTPPEVTELELPPQTEVDDTAPEMPEPIGDTAVLVPEIAPEATPREAPRVAPEPVEQPVPEVRPDLDEQPAVTPDAEAEAETVVEEPQKAQTPEDSTTEIVTEADKAPAASARPPGRRPPPPPPVEVAEAPEEPAETPEPDPTPEPEPEPVETPSTTDDAIADALSEVLGQPEAEAPVPSGPPLSSGERESLRVAVSACWNIGALSTEASRTTVIVGLQMNQDGTPVASSIRLLSSSGGSDAAARQAFEAAKRAVIRCGSRGYDLPQEKYSQWQDIEMTFDPMRSR
ncbi:energy transducer TonB [Sulfitobacter sp. S0837]|uniref:energy transducer TonB n=1 Tax=Sulfitobacter maritimus TaxID=2741719 RepID=UPI001581E2B9|nr:energy transducer TonB [Sulfitobacter maritimus]